MDKKITWIASSRKDLRSFPEEVRGDIGTALFVAQQGGKHPDAKPFKGIGNGIMEIVSRFDKNTYRAVYVVNLGDTMYVLHAFQKKSKSGIKTPQEEIDIIRERYKQAVELKKLHNRKQSRYE